MSTDRRDGSLLAEALELSRAMRTAAQAEDWTTLNRLETRRSEILSPPLAEELANHEALSTLMALDAEIRTAVAAARDRAASEWRSARDGHRAAQHYSGA
jgi:hypothetical protein